MLLVPYMWAGLTFLPRTTLLQIRVVREEDLNTQPPDYKPRTLTTCGNTTSFKQYFSFHFQLCQDVIQSQYVLGVQRVQRYGNSLEFKLLGNPWSCGKDGHDGIHGRNMICHLINAQGSNKVGGKWGDWIPHFPLLSRSPTHSPFNYVRYADQKNVSLVSWDIAVVGSQQTELRFFHVTVFPGPARLARPTLANFVSEQNGPTKK